MGRTARRLDAAVTFGERVRKERNRLGLSQMAMAEEVGVHYTYISSIERGERNVSLENIVRIAEVLGVDPSKLVKGLQPTP
jgi:transcriptional regulator with XRE-family HTH domain